MDKDKVNPTLPECNQLLRVHIISAQFDNASENWKTHCVVKVGDKTAETLSHPLTVCPSTGRKCIVWQENFMVEYDHGRPDLDVQVFSHKDLLGTAKLQINDIPPSKDTWDKVAPKEYSLSDSKDNSIGKITLRIRRETKVFGSLVVNLTKGQFEGSAEKGVNSVMATLKHTNQVFSKAPVAVTDGHFEFPDYNKSFEINKDNNVFDLFIELWEVEPGHGIPAISTQALLEPAPTAPVPEKKENLSPVSRERMIGQARLPLFDTRTPFHWNLPVFTVDHKLVAKIHLSAELHSCEKKTATASPATKTPDTSSNP